MIGDAVFSPCGSYRYVLRRRWDRRPPLVFVMLNPSTADAVRDDPTMRRCIGFARRLGHGGIVVVNLFALISPQPEALRAHAAPIGPDNDAWIRRVTSARGARIVAGWGANARHHEARVREVLAMLPRPLHALKLTRDEHPSHPGRLPYACRLQRWPAT